ncbi:hypothetical protein B0H63DRAFT_22036 [Podospora didyma]|uniref:Uncharacterized protein n=1 Tax=Podospora didyma TaxID=330526 RepID=A0AAE0P5C2_9PEZI|nr:hypothetical protein B0H63DRAFT_22036 [Podospora didyma]
MNSDELMSDPGSFYGGGNDSRAESEFINNTGNIQSEMLGSGSKDKSSAAAAGPAAWNTKKFRDDYDMAKQRLTDQNGFPDPLWHRPRPPKTYPAGVTSETEQQLKALIANIRAKNASGGSP